MAVNKREELKKAYPKSAIWHEKVKHMSEEQVTAIYIRFSNQGRLGR